jgi:hypothetical protein
MSMKYYVYISDTKVDMLYSQIPKKIRDKIAVELGINLGMFSVTVKGKENQEKTPLETRIEKLELVVRYIEDNMDVGTVEQPQAYFKGLLPMRWGPCSETPDLVFFGCETEQTFLGLGGWLGHIIGNQSGESSTKLASSATPFIISILTELELSTKQPKKLNVLLEPWQAQFTGNSAKDNAKVLAMTRRAAKLMEGREENLEFFAKRLAEGTIDAQGLERAGESDHVVLGTPLYVAMVD